MIKPKVGSVMKELNHVRKILMATAIIVLSIPAIASVGDKNELKGVSVKVSYADLNLEKEEGAKVLYRRLQQASKQTCDVRGLRIAGSVKRMVETQRCYREALSAAVEKIDNELVTNIHDS